MAIRNVSDTAKWVAEYRAMETDRPDAIFRDPYARRLAGVEGARIVDSLKQGRALAWPMIVPMTIAVARPTPIARTNAIGALRDASAPFTSASDARAGRCH